MKIQNNLRNPQNPHILSFPARLLRLGLLGLAFLLAQGAFAQTIRYVQEGGTGTGSSWADASGNLQAMINASASGDEVWVAAGTYRPTTGTDRSISFAMQNDLAIYGGFAGTETMFGERDWVANVTTLSGDIGTPGDNSDNSYRVIVNTDLNNSALIDGFTISGAYADGFNGGGMLNQNSSPTITNCVFTDNLSSGGGAMANINSSSPVITGCSFTGNTSQGNGGAVLNQSSSPSFSSCSFTGNSSNGRGGGVHALSSSPAFTNCVFSGNTAASRGGGLSLNASPSTVMNCSFSGNTAGSNEDGIYALNSSATITNSILWGNGNELGNSGSTFTVTYSIVQGGYGGTGNLDADPLFVSQPPIGLGTTGDLHLQACSPAKDAGTATGAPATDFDGDARPQGPGFDMGFDESTTSCCPPGNIVFVDADATGGNNGTSWADAYTDLQDALAEADNCSNITQIWVATGTYYPDQGVGYTPGDRSHSFVMKNDVAIFGGLAGNEPSGYDMSLRDFTANETILSGDIGTVGNNGDNSYHVISNNNNNGLNSTAVLDGFAITGGNANGSGSSSGGGGMYNNDSSPTVTNCSFSGNNSNNFGGGMYNFNNSSPTVTNCSFSGNNSNNDGGGMRNVSSSPTVTNCSFSGNSADSSTGEGGGMSNSTSSPTVTNCIFWGNAIEIENVLSSTPTVTYSIVQGGYAGTGNIDADPLFVDQPPIGLGTSGDLRLQASSCAIDNGLNSAVPTGVTTDLDGNDRFYNAGQVDMGAYEFQGNFQAPVITIPPTTTNNGLHFDGTDDHVKIYTDCNSTTLFPGGDAITVEYWFKGTNSQSAVRLQNGGGYIVTAWGNSQHILSNDGGTAGISVGSGFDDGNWHHLAFTWQRNTANGFKSYLDGQLVEERQSSDDPLPAFNSGFFLGSYNGTGEFTNGTLDEVRIWTVARKQAEIQASFCSGLSGPQTGLLQEFVFDHGTAGGSNTGIDVVENTANANAPGLLQNFALSGNASNWVEGIPSPCTCGPNGIVYVDTNASGNNDGSSWTNAFNNLQDALSLANTCADVTQIWVAAGTYYPDQGVGYTPGDRSHSFVMKNNLDIFGGLAGNEPSGYDMSQRDFTANETILSGDIDQDGTLVDNSIHVISNLLNSLNSSAVLDGFTISGGNADGSSSNNTRGGGMYNRSSSPTVTNCSFSGNSANISGGGMSNRSSSPTVTNCSFSGNTGDGMENNTFSSPTVTNCSFSGNTGSGMGNASSSPTVTNSSFSGNTDGGMHNNSSSPTVTNCSFSGNIVDGGMFNFSSSPTVTNCSFSSNIGGAMHNVYYSSPTVTNCILWGGIAITNNFISFSITNSIVQGGCPVGATCTDVLDVDPLFVSPPPFGLGTTGDLRLQSCSPAIDAGDNAANSTTEDLDGATRKVDATNSGTTTIDLGAYEFQGTMPTPTASCAANLVVQLDANHSATVTADQVGAGSAGCAPLSFLIDNMTSQIFDCNTLGSHTVTLQVTDLFNQTATANCTFTIADDDNPCCDAPVAQCKSFDAVLVGNSVTITASDVDNGSTADCGQQSLTIDLNTFDCSHVGTPQTVRLTITDINNDADFCDATVNVVDEEDPLITCPGNQIVNANASCAGTVGAWSAASSSDNCGSVTVTQSPLATTPLSGHNDVETVTLTADDGNGNTADCSFTVTLQDVTNPTVTCPGTQTVQADIFGDYTVVDFTGLATAADNCTASPAKSQSPVPGTVLTVGNHTVTITVTDGVSLTGECTFALTVQAGCAAPTVTCPANQTVAANGSCAGTLGDYTGLATVVGGCGNSTLTQSPLTGTALSLSTIPVTITATDEANNTNSCTFNVTLSDQTNPVITCPGNQTVNADASCAGTVGAWSAVSSSDNCGSVTVTQSPVATTPLSGHNDVETVTLTADDGNGNTADCSFTVTLKDVTDPVITCTVNQTVNADASCAGTVGAWSAASFSDNCGSVTVTQSPLATTPLSGHNDVETVTLTADDGNGNMADCSFTVTLKDVTAPMVTCPGTQTVQADVTGNYYMEDFTGLASASDNCTASPAKTQSPTVATILGIGNQTVTITATDDVSLTGDCTFTLAVQAGCAAPTVTCPAAQTVAADGSCAGTLNDYTGSALVSSGCGIVTLAQSPIAGTVLSLGTISVTLTATDESNNTSSCSFDVTLEDQAKPSITCPGNQTVNADAFCEGTVGTWSAVAASDNCGTANVSQSPVATTPLSGHNDVETVTLTADDGNGNTADCSFTVTLKDVTGPVITCPVNQTVNADASCAGTVGAWSAASFSDNCSSVTVTQSPLATTPLSGHNDVETVTLTADDGNGNMADCSFTVTLKDVSNPTVTCPGTQNVQADIFGNYTVVDFTSLATASDNCTASLSKSQSPAPNDILTVGNHTVTITATDDVALAGDCTFALEVTPSCQPPTVSCPTTQTVFASPSCNQSLLDYRSLATVDDGCGTTSISQDPLPNSTVGLGNHEVTITVTDQTNNQSSCNFTVSVVDNTPPTFTCPDNQNVNVNPGTCHGTVPDLLAGITDAYDNCGTATLSQNPLANSLFSGSHLGQVNVIVSADDGNGNTTPCTVVLTLIDNEPPVPACFNPTVMLDGNGQYTLLETDVFNAANSTDNCGAVNFVSMDIGSVDCNNVWNPATVTVTATDGNGNTAECTATVSVEDNSLPAPQCKTTTVQPVNDLVQRPRQRRLYRLYNTDWLRATNRLQGPRRPRRHGRGLRRHQGHLVSRSGLVPGLRCGFLRRLAGGCAVLLSRRLPPGGGPDRGGHGLRQQQCGGPSGGG